MDEHSLPVSSKPEKRLAKRCNYQTRTSTGEIPPNVAHVLAFASSPPFSKVEIQVQGMGSGVVVLDYVSIDIR